MRRLLILAAALPLAACISFGADPPPSLLTLTPAERVPAGRSLTAEAGRTVTILYPSVPQALSTTRVPVQSDATTIAYLKDAQWVEAPNRLFQQLVAETVEARTSRPVLSPRQAAGIDPGARLTGQLVNFGIDAATSSAVVTFDAVMARSATQVETRRFEARVPVSRIEATPAGIALNQAANQVAVEVSDWIGG